MSVEPRPDVVPLCVLGPITVGADRPPLRRQSRMALGWLVLQRGEPMSLDRLARLIWSEPPSSARRQLRTVVRQDLPSLVVLDGDRARLEVSAIDLDEDRFTALTDDGARVADLEAGLRLWSGPRPYLEIADHPDALAAVHHLERRRLRALARLHQDRIRRGEVARVVSDLAAELTVEPDCTDLRQLHALALAMTGRRIEALRELHVVMQALGHADPWTVAANAAVQVDDEETLHRLVDALDV